MTLTDTILEFTIAATTLYCVWVLVDAAFSLA